MHMRNLSRLCLFLEASPLPLLLLGDLFEHFVFVFQELFLRIGLTEYPFVDVEINF